MDVESFITRWQSNEGGAERANYALFLTELCDLLDLPRPDPADANHDHNDYVFERAVTFRNASDKTGNGRIDLYKRGCFVLEAKQSRERGGRKEVELPDEQRALPGMDAAGPRGRRSAHRGWDVLMRNAREQAEQYARALPADHVWPPFILVADVGHAIEVFADFSGQGRNYRQFPDRAGFRVYLEDLRDEKVRERLRLIWTDPHRLDPARHAAEVTRDIARRLASVSKLLEARGHAAERVAHFLMRVLFTMFAEDTGLIERGRFTEVLDEARAHPPGFAPMLEELWEKMDAGGFSTTLRLDVRKFNGGLFAERTAIPLEKEEIGELYEAAKHVWTDVEPAIFGTLLEQALDKDERRQLPVSFVMAVPDHPWTKATKDAAAVRIAMTVVAAGKREGMLLDVLFESRLDTDAPELVLRTLTGEVHADLTVGADVTRTKSLLANEWLCSPGVKLHGSGFIVSPREAEALGLGKRQGLENHIRSYRNGRDLMNRPRGAMVIDLFGLDEREVRQRYPEVYQHLLQTVKPEREKNNRASYRENWWIFGEPRAELRPALATLGRYIATVETSKHRVFQFLSTDVLPDNKLVCLALAEAEKLGVVQSHVHQTWYLANAGMIGVFDQPAVYVKTSSFDPFPFPDATPEQRKAIGDLAEELDATRKEVLAEHPDLTLTGLYNLREKLMKGEAFSDAEADQRSRGRVDIIAELHDRIDAAVADAYGWPADLPDEEIVARLVALNAERHAEEQQGKVRWLRPDYQIPKAGLTQLPAKAGAEQIEALLPEAGPRKPSFPRDAIGQTAAVIAELRGGAALSAEAIARRYAQGRKVERRIAATLGALVRLGHVVAEGDGYRLRKAA